MPAERHAGPVLGDEGADQLPGLGPLSPGGRCTVQRRRIIGACNDGSRSMADTATANSIDVTALNASAAFNRWAGFEVVRAEAGQAELLLAWRAELGQYAGFLHAAMIGGMIDTACGFAACTVVGRVLASHVSINCLAPAIGDAFVARARVVKAGRRQVFARAELYALRGAEERLVATGDVILVPVAEASHAPPLIASEQAGA
jgi:uncharacterized protein (TIGR00369 family)